MIVGDTGPAESGWGGMDAAQVHKDAVVFDGLIVVKWGQQVFEDIHRGGLAAANT